MYGQVVGINSSKIITDGYEGMGFAIPVSKAKDIIDQLLSGGYVEGRVRLGHHTGSDISATQAAFYGVPRGFMIVSIDEDRPLPAPRPSPRTSSPPLTARRWRSFRTSPTCCCATAPATR